MDEREEGFTLIELLVVIIIIGILAAIAIPVFLSQRKKGYDAGVKSDMRNLATAEESYLTDNPSAYTTSSANVDSNGWKLTNPGTSQIWIVLDQADASRGYCIAGNDTRSTNAFVYDSQNGGLQNAPVTGATAAAALAAAEAVCTGSANYTGGTFVHVT
jgi:prepilin-type N-terminal cleavage/methylation domain-containing protein